MNDINETEQNKYAETLKDTAYWDTRSQMAAYIRKKQAELDPIREKVKDRFQSIGFFPKVSIVIPVYNGAKYMKSAIDSALFQTYPNIEVIVVNDGSIDNGLTDKIAVSYGDFVRYFTKSNGGVATALNLGIEKMTGEYFSWLSHDDMYEPQKIEDELIELSKHTDRTRIVAEGYKIVDAKEEYLYKVNLYEKYSAEKLNIPLFCLLRGGINGCALLIHRSHFERVGTFNTELPTTQDYDLWFRMMRGQEIYYLPSSNVLSRSHEEQGSKTMLGDHIAECDELWIGMMKALSQQERIALSKSSCLFYKEMWEYLKGATGYRGAIAYAERMLLSEAIAEYERTRRYDMLAIVAKHCDIKPYQVRRTILPYRKKNKSRIFFQLGERDAAGGLNRIVVQTANALAAKYDVIIGCWDKPRVNGYKSNDLVTEFCYKYPVGKFDKYAEIMYLLQVDVYISSYCCLPEMLQLSKEIKKVGIRTVLWSHEDYFLPYWRDSLWRSLPQRHDFFPKADAVVWINSNSLSIYKLQYKNGVCIPNQISIEPTDPICQHRGKRLIAVGRFDDAIKGFDDLLRGFSRVLEHHKDAELYVIGTYDLDLPVKDSNGMTCGEFIKKSGIPENKLHFVKWTNNIAQYYQTGILHIMPSLLMASDWLRWKRPLTAFLRLHITVREWRI